MNSYRPPASGIRFNDCLFSEPVGLAGWMPPQFAGLFAVSVETHWAPKPYQAICFGEFGNNAPISALLGDQAWLLAAAHGKNLVISVCPMPFSTTAERRAVRDELIWAYNPICQANRKHLAEPRYLPEPEKELPRRRIGFMPECDPPR